MSLMNIREHINYYIRMTTAILDVTVDVVDADLVRIAGLKRFDSEIGKRVRHGHIFSPTIKNGQEI